MSRRQNENATGNCNNVSQECGNPILLQWLDEMLKDARMKNLKTQYGLAKACKSMKSYPIAFESPLDAVQLEGIGALTAERLFKKWKEKFPQQGGTASNSQSVVKTGTLQIQNVGEGEEGIGNDSARSFTNTSQGNISIAAQTLQPDHSTDELNHNLSQPGVGGGKSGAIRKKATRTKEKMYIPKYQSGAFALLVGLYKSAILYGREYYISKSELIAISQSYCGTSLDTPSQSSNVGKGRYSSWVGIKTLEKREYAIRQGSSAKYCLGDAGVEPAQKITAVLVKAQIEKQIQNIQSNNSNPNEMIDLDTSYVNGIEDRSYQVLGTDETAEIEVSIDDMKLFEKGASLFTENTNDNSQQSAAIGTTRGEHLADTNYISNLTRYSNLDCQDIVFNLEDISKEIINTEMADPGVQSDSSSNYYDFGYRYDDNFLNANLSEDFTFDYSDNVEINDRNGADLSINLDQSNTTNRNFISNSSNSNNTSANANRDNTIDVSINEYIGESIVNPVLYEASSYDIILIVDAREIRSAADRDGIINGLHQRGVKAETMPLPVGDYAWVARPKPQNPNYSYRFDHSQGQSQTSNSQGTYQVINSSNTNSQSSTSGRIGVDTNSGYAYKSKYHLPGTEDIVLNTVIERKRMSDLCSSITDGRIAEQKYRLQTCGINKIIYIIEGDDSEVVNRLGENYVYETMLRLSILHNISVKRLPSVEETVDYLSRMTKLFINKSKKDRLYILPDSGIDRFSVGQIKERLMEMYPDRDYCLTFDTFFRISGKSSNISIAEVFAKCLLTVRGLSEEKVLSLIKLFPTPKSFEVALKKSKTFDEQVKRLVELEGTSIAIRRRKLSKGLAEKVVGLWCSMEYQD